MEDSSDRVGRSKRKLLENLDVVGWATILTVPLAIAGLMLTIGIAIGSPGSSGGEVRDAVAEPITETVTEIETITERPSAAPTPSVPPPSPPGEESSPPHSSDPQNPEPPPAGIVLHQQSLDLESGPNYWDLDEWQRTEEQHAPATDINVTWSGRDYYLNANYTTLVAEVAIADRAACVDATNYTRTAIRLRDDQYVCARTAEQNLALLVVRPLPRHSLGGNDTVSFDATVWDEP